MSSENLTLSFFFTRTTTAIVQHREVSYGTRIIHKVMYKKGVKTLADLEYALHEGDESF